LLRDKVGPDGTVIGIEESPEMATVAPEYIARQGWRNVMVVQLPTEDARLGETGGRYDGHTPA
jgi:predicted O-methyltransferase YrrM